MSQPNQVSDLEAQVTEVVLVALLGRVVATTTPQGVPVILGAVESLLPSVRLVGSTLGTLRARLVALAAARGEVGLVLGHEATSFRGRASNTREMNYGRYHSSIKFRTFFYIFVKR